ncbi:hypothetical protein OURE66S_03240 [Oligella ureolytica]
MHASNVSGTPAIIFDNGKRISGFATAKDMIEKANKVTIVEQKGVAVAQRVSVLLNQHKRV